MADKKKPLNRKPPSAVMHPFVFPEGYYPGDALARPPAPLPEQEPEKVQGVAEGGEWFGPSDLPVEMVNSPAAKLLGQADAKRRKGI